mmetsp:Transcript_31743/g.94735  ORF Transcript_31743/g.94735 Transcript_31743/m.94735 type:complete len:391 (+) Transcript_31743:3077-4249(+)
MLRLSQRACQAALHCDVARGAASTAQQRRHLRAARGVHAGEAAQHRPAVRAAAAELAARLLLRRQRHPRHRVAQHVTPAGHTCRASALPRPLLTQRQGQQASAPEWRAPYAAVPAVSRAASALRHTRKLQAVPAHRGRRTDGERTGGHARRPRRVRKHQALAAQLQAQLRLRARRKPHKGRALGRARAVARHRQLHNVAKAAKYRQQAGLVVKRRDVADKQLDGVWLAAAEHASGAERRRRLQRRRRSCGRMRRRRGALRVALLLQRLVHPPHNHRLLHAIEGVHVMQPGDRSACLVPRGHGDQPTSTPAAFLAFVCAEQHHRHDRAKVAEDLEHLLLVGGAQHVAEEHCRAVFFDAVAGVAEGHVGGQLVQLVRRLRRRKIPGPDARKV